jgi:hypothetical protein
MVVPTATLLAACASSSTPGPTGTVVPSTSTAQPTPTPTPDACKFRNDSVHAKQAPLVQVQAPKSAPSEVEQDLLVPCSTVVRVNDTGIADVTFAQAATCELTQDPTTPAQQAKLTTRDPLTVLLRLGGGKVACTLTGTKRITLCGIGTLLADGTTAPVQVVARCDEDPTVTISTYAGTLGWYPAHGTAQRVKLGMQLFYDAATGEGGQNPAGFGPPEDGLFEAQANALGVHPRVPPMLRLAPEISGPDASGIVTTTRGEWAGTDPITVTYQWQGQCDASGSGCSDIPGQTGAKYQTTAADCPNVLVVVTAANRYGKLSQTSQPVPVACSVP